MAKSQALTYLASIDPRRVHDMQVGADLRTQVKTTRGEVENVVLDLSFTFSDLVDALRSMTEGDCEDAPAGVAVVLNEHCDLRWHLISPRRLTIQPIAARSKAMLSGM